MWVVHTNHMGRGTPELGRCPKRAADANDPSIPRLQPSGVSKIVLTIDEFGLGTGNFRYTIVMRLYALLDREERIALPLHVTASKVEPATDSGNQKAHNNHPGFDTNMQHFSFGRNHRQHGLSPRVIRAKCFRLGSQN